MNADKYFFQESDSGQKKEIDLDSSFESSDDSDIEVNKYLWVIKYSIQIFVG